jgi:hypothetical protein
MLGSDLDDDPTPPSPEGVGSTDGDVDPHADKSPWAQMGGSVCALTAVKNRATEKAINSREHLRTHDLMLFVFRSQITRAGRRMFTIGDLPSSDSVPTQYAPRIVTTAGIVWVRIFKSRKQLHLLA